MIYAQTADNQVLMSFESPLPVAYTEPSVTKTDKTTCTLFQLLCPTPIDIPDTYHMLVPHATYLKYNNDQHLPPKYSREFLEGYRQEYFKFYDAIHSYNAAIENLKFAPVDIISFSLDLYSISDNSLLHRVLNEKRYQKHLVYGEVNSKQAELELKTLSPKDIELFLTPIEITADMNYTYHFLQKDDYIDRFTLCLDDYPLINQLTTSQKSFVVYYPSDGGRFLGAPRHSFESANAMSNAQMFSSVEEAREKAGQLYDDFVILETQTYFKAVAHSQCPKTSDFIERLMQKDLLAQNVEKSIPYKKSNKI